MPKRQSAPAARAAPKGRAQAPARTTTTTAESPWRSMLVKNRTMLALVLAAVHLVFAFLFFEPQMHNGGDNAAYLALARSLIDGTGYREIYDPATPVHTQYPPIFPLLLAGLLLLGFQPWVPFKILIVVCSTAAIVLSFFWMRRKLRPEMAFTIALLMALSPGVLGLSHWELSDVPFWTFTIGALLAWERLGPHNTKRLAVATVLTLLAYFTRSAGLPLIAAAGIWLVWRRRWQQLAIFAVSIAPFVLWWWWRARTQGGVDYVQQFWWIDPYDPERGSIGVFDLFGRAADNGVVYLRRHLPLLLIGASNAIGIILGIAVLILAVIGWIRRLRHAQVAELFLPLYIGLLLIWPAVWSGERFLVPALPLILFYAAESLQRLLRRLWPARVRALSLATAGLILLLSLPELVTGARYGMFCTSLYLQGDRYACHRDNWKDFFYLSELAGRALPEDAVVLSRKPRLLWAVSGGTPSRIYPFSREPDSLFAVARAARARYVVLDRVDGITLEYLAPVIMSRPDAFCILYGYGPDRSAILAIKPEAERARTTTLPQGDQAVQFDICGPEYWRSRAVMDSVFGR